MHELCRDPKIGQLNIPLLVNQNIACLDIPMYSLPLMQILQPLQSGLKDGSYMLLGQPQAGGSPQNILDGATGTILQKQTDALLIDLTAEALDDTGVVAVDHDVDLFTYALVVLLAGLRRQDLYGADFARLLVHCFVDLAVGTGAQQALHLELFS